jgi:hypothetical protein
LTRATVGPAALRPRRRHVQPRLIGLVSTWARHEAVLLVAAPVSRASSWSRQSAPRVEKQDSVAALLFVVRCDSVRRPGLRFRSLSKQHSRAAPPDHAARGACCAKLVVFWAKALGGGALLRAHPLVKASPDSDHEARAARVLELYETSPFDGPVISFDRMGPISSNRSRAPAERTANGPNGCPRPTTASTGSATSSARWTSTRPSLCPGAPSPRRQRRPRLHANDPPPLSARQRICWIQDSLSLNWTHDVRRFAANNKIQFVPTPTYASYLTGSRATSARPRVRRQQHRLPDWDTAQRALDDYITHRNGRDTDRRTAALEPNTESLHEQVISGQILWVGPTHTR